MSGRIVSHSGLRGSLAGLALLSFLLLAMAIPSHVSAGIGQYVVDGQVYRGDSAHPISGASILVEVYYASGTLRYTYPETVMTDSSGLYMVTIEGANWDVGNRIKVTATYSSESEDSEHWISEDDPGGWTIDVVFQYAIPQLAGQVGLLVGMIVVGTVAIVFLRRRDQGQ